MIFSKRVIVDTLFALLIALLTSLVVFGMFQIQNMEKEKMPDFLSSISHFLNYLEMKSFDLRVFLKGYRKPAPGVMICAIDHKSVERVGRFPWSRSIIASLIKKIHDAGAKAVGVDILFSEEENEYLKKKFDHEMRKLQADISNEKYKDEHEKSQMETSLKEIEKIRISPEIDSDRVLEEAVSSTNAVLAYRFLYKQGRQEVVSFDIYGGEKQYRIMMDAVDNWACYSGLAPSQVLSNGKVDKEQVAYMLELPIPRLRDKTFLGHASVHPDMDGVVRHYPIFSTLISADGILRLLAPLAVQAYILGYSLDANKIEYNSDRRILKLGDVKIPVNRSGQALLDFCGEGSYRILLTEEKEGLIPAVSAVDIIEEKDEVKLASIFKDNIVFLGVTEIGVGDYVATPTSPTFPGVEVHATLLENMLSGRLFTPESPTVANDLYLALVIGLVIGLITRASKPILGLILVLTIVIGCNWFVYKRFLHGEYLRSIYPSLLIFGVYGTTTIFKFTREIKNKALIRSMFHHYLSPSVVGELLKDPSKLKLGGEKKIATVFFSDVEGFTPISEKLAPEQVSDIMNLYFASVSDIILRQGGYVDKYIGDGVMAVFGVPIPQEDHALRACLSAIESVKAISALRNELVQRGLPEINIRIGINTGELIVGNMGSKSRLNYTVMGDTVNIASRLEAINKELKTRIAIGEQTYIQVKDILKTREYKDVHIKGKAEALTVYEVLVEQDGTSNTQKEN